MKDVREPKGRGAPPSSDVVTALMDSSQDGVLLLDPRTRVAAINPAARRLLGWTPRGRARPPASSVLRTVVSGDDPVQDAFRTAFSEREVVLVARGGAEVPVALITRRIGKPPWVVVILRDLTQMRRMQHELRQRERLATLGQLSAGVAHEIRNPLAGIGTSAQVLLRRFEPRDERARFVRVILDEVERLDRIVGSLLEYARPRAPELRPSALEPCITRVVELSDESLRHGGIVVEVDVAPRLSRVFLDADLATQVLLNVTLNAIQAMPSGGRLRYEVRQLRRRSPPRGSGRRAGDSGANGRARRTPVGPWMPYQQVRISDTGQGIPRGVLPKLFDPFFSTKPRGTGLGLSISQTIMQEHGGTIAVASREGRGTTVLLNFPVEKRHGERRKRDPHAVRSAAAHR